MERKVGEIFRAGGYFFQCVENRTKQPCYKACDMLTGGNCVGSLMGAGECLAVKRGDKKAVRFIKCKLPEA